MISRRCDDPSRLPLAVVKAYGSLAEIEGTTRMPQVTNDNSDSANCFAEQPANLEHTAFAIAGLFEDFEDSTPQETPEPTSPNANTVRWLWISGIAVVVAIVIFL